MAVATPLIDKTDEQKAITDMVRQFADEQIVPNAEHFDHEDEFPEVLGARGGAGGAGCLDAQPVLHLVEHVKRFPHIN